MRTLRLIPTLAVSSALALAALFTARAGSAQDASPTVPARRDDARSHFDRGVALGERGHWAEAVVELEAARTSRATAAVHFNLGVAYRAVGRDASAVESLRAYLRASPTLPPDRVRAIDDMIASSGRRIAHVSLTVEPSSATITIDGTPMSSTARGLDLDPGRHLLVAESDNRRHAHRVLQLAPGSSSHIDLELPRVSDSARIQIETNVASALLRIDGHAVSMGSADEFVPPGAHSIHATAPGFSTFRRDANLLAGGSLHLRVSLTDQRTVFASPWFWVGSVAVAGALVVTGFLVFSRTEPGIGGPFGHIDNALTVRP